MAGNRIIVCLGALCCLLLIVTTVSAADDDIQLPSIWQLAVTGTYNALYQLELANSDKVLTLEEWASYNRRLFRLDLVGPEGRMSYLTNGMTGELLRYQPFVCEQINGEKSEDLGTIAQLFFGYEWNDDEAHKKKGAPVSAFGLGPLWLRARKDAQKVSQRRLKMISSEASYDEFEVTMKPDLIKDQIDYKVRFYFVRGEPAQFVDFIDWIDVGKQGEPIVKARARVIQVNYRRALDESVFEIPVGYGCPRQPDQELALNIDVGLQLLHSGAPNQVTFEVITSRPESSGDSTSGNGSRADVGSWTSSRYSLRMMRLSKGRLDSVDKTESYYASFMQFRDTNPQPGRAGKLRRIKRVWWAPDSERGQATVYTIDLASGECQINHQDVRNQILLNFSGLSVSPLVRKQAATAGKGNEDALSQGLMVLSVEQISFLFSDNQDYHLVHLGETRGPAATSRLFRNRVYEKRVQNFQLTGNAGLITWKGPVSIVKQISTYSQLLDIPSVWEKDGINLNTMRLSSDFSQRVTIFFYAEDQTKLMYKAVIDVLDTHEVSLEYAHEQLDVSSCFDSSTKQNVIIKYPLETAQVARQLQDKQAAIRSQVFVKLFTHLSSAFSSLQIYGIEPTFDVFNMRLQLSILDMPLSQTFEMQVGVELAAVDENEGQKQPTRGLVERTSELGPAIIQTTSSNADGCADHCEHYNCMRFSYDLASRACKIELIRERVKTTICATCQLYSYLERHETKALAREPEDDRDDRDDHDDHDTSATSGSTGRSDTNASATTAYRGRAHFSADSIVEYLCELVDSAQISGEEESPDTVAAATAVADHYNPLVLTLDLAPDFEYVHDNEQKKKHERRIVTLRPSALEHDLENMQEYTRELEELADAGMENEQHAVVVRVSGRSIRLQFKILLENHLFKDISGDALEGFTYEECERHCETTDCRSFSYCQRDETCIIKWAHMDRMIRILSKEAPHAWQCNVYSLDYLSKFEPYGGAVPPVKASGSEPANSPRDCANACMDAQSYECQGFYYCQIVSNMKTHMCYMVDVHVNSMLDHERTRLLNPAEVLRSRETLARGSRECSFYSRSYLAQFDKYYARRLNLDKSDEMGVRISAGHDLEFCAKQCIKMDVCLGFDACPEDGGGGASSSSSSPDVTSRLQHASSRRSKQTQCHLAVKSIRGSQLKREPRCTTFILSDKSHFNSHKLKLIHDESAAASASNGRAESLKPDKEANIARNTGAGVVAVSGASQDTGLAKDINGKQLELLENLGEIGEDSRGPANASYVDLASHWLAKFCSLILGVLLGFGFILGWNEAYARGWIDRARTRVGLL